MDQERENHRRYYQENREDVRENHRRYYQQNREDVREIARQYREAHLEERREKDRQWRADIRGRVLSHYGCSCQCCGSTDRPTIDHVNGGGAQHRAEIGKGWATYVWLIRNNFPEGFQTLCHPCNASKGNRDRCCLDHGVVIARRHGGRP